ncbi:MAG: hypothetical protein V3T56_07730 [Gemmatimonadales bacterium]
MQVIITNLLENQLPLGQAYPRTELTAQVDELFAPDFTRVSGTKATK